ncbi:hypothetical protein GCM10010182_16970 [Actinomadura cremea]|nr:hypothetical protein GCM10010182_16970 [Actinomadura cremea]
MEELRGGSADNPFVIGRPRAQRFMRVMASMVRGRIADDLESAASAEPSRACC